MLTIRCSQVEEYMRKLNHFAILQDQVRHNCFTGAFSSTKTKTFLLMKKTLITEVEAILILATNKGPTNTPSFHQTD